MLLRLSWLLALLLAALPARGAELRLLPPGLAYCDELAARFSRLPGARQDAARGLAAEGGRLCEAGHARAGVARLRRALRAAQGAPRLARSAHP
ncbi:hypothetical protein CR162_10690 [Pseudoroseomonas rhizosphaerae]|uniref:Uncharacterized protein n=1 Tax=Teichococcus rhizosphaerae TaxID=1335062 RepID=A0A2C7A4A7_9PROT|nr:hypothetical protein [Pseudoroseomonas rhizosphaerae]PHK94898.1 hypothetical protein CR162_10690 [Pseudoroseomonas rhizosphaerae]